MSGQPGASPAALANGAVHAQLVGHSTMPLQLGPPPGRAEDAIIVSGFTEQQLATLKRQVRQWDCAASHTVWLRTRVGICALARLHHRRHVFV